MLALTSTRCLGSFRIFVLYIYISHYSLYTFIFKALYSHKPIFTIDAFLHNNRSIDIFSDFFLHGYFVFCTWHVANFSIMKQISNRYPNEDICLSIIHEYQKKVEYQAQTNNIKIMFSKKVIQSVIHLLQTSLFGLKQY